MDATALYNIAKGFVNKIKNEKPSVAEEIGGSMCLVVTDDEQIFSAMTGIGIYDGHISVCPAECVAPAAMFAAGRSKAKQIIVISMEDCSISIPCIECLEMLICLDADNNNCEAAVSEDRLITARELLSNVTSSDDTPEEASSDTTSPAVDFFSGFGDNDVPADGSASSAVFQGGFDESYFAPQHEPVKKSAEDKTAPSTLGAPAEYASSVVIDESNPFYAPPQEETENSAPAQSLSDKNKETKASNEITSDQGSKNLSKEELLKQAKQMKKIAKANFNFFKNRS